MTCKDCISEKVCRYNDGINLYCKENYECPHFKNKSDYAKVKHGYWLLDGRCSECLVNPLTTHKSYCPRCGAKMEGV